MPIYLIAVAPKRHQPEAGRDILMGYAEGVEMHDACRNLLRREGMTPESVGLGWTTYFEATEAAAGEAVRYHLWDSEGRWIFDAHFPKGSAFLQWFLGHRSDGGKLGAHRSWAACEGSGCPGCAHDPRRQGDCPDCTNTGCCDHRPCSYSGGRGACDVHGEA